MIWWLGVIAVGAILAGHIRKSRKKGQRRLLKSSLKSFVKSQSLKQGHRRKVGR